MSNSRFFACRILFAAALFGTGVAQAQDCLRACEFPVSTPQSAVPGSAAERPNIVLMMADDLGWGDVGFNGNTTIRTPHLDAMARDGLKLNRFYAAAPVCSPTRGSCLTGRHPFRYGIPFANSGHLKREEITVAELLREVGYTTGHFGKWHLGTLSPNYSGKGAQRKPGRNYMPPSENGFDEWFSTEFAVSTWNPYSREYSHVKGANAGDPRNCYWHNGTNVRGGLEGDDSRIIMDKAIPFMTEAVKADKPFFAVIWFHAPHKPVVAGPRHRAMYAEHPEGAQHYFGCITAMDEQVGRLRKTLRAFDVNTKTLLCFCSDNGPEGRRQGENTNWGTAAPFRGRKRSLYEGGVRVAAAMEWTGRIRPGTETDVAAVTSDYLPTIVELAGAEFSEQRPRDGISLVGLLDGQLKSRGQPIGFQSQNQRSWSDQRYKLITTDKGKSWELYDLVADPSETQDISAAHADRVIAMRSALAAWVRSCAASSEGGDYPE